METQPKTVSYFAFPGIARRRITTERIKHTVSSFYDLMPEEIDRKTRKREISQPRQVVMYICKEYKTDSLANIGRKIGRKDHATVLHACKTINNLIDTDKKMAAEINEIRSILEEKYITSGNGS